ncbi:MAG: preprotein translocase subunit SecY [Coprobacillus sp.]|nr:preprotein translocase subunit SecY [Coprobacillus sp.]
MKKFVAVLKNKEIMSRIAFTIVILFVFRLGCQITVPGVTVEGDLSAALEANNALSLMNLLGGGTLQTFSIFALGVSPYITAEIIINLLSTDVLPALTDLKRQGQYGRKKIEMATRYLTLLIGAVEAYGIIQMMNNGEYDLYISFNTGSAEWLSYIYVVVIMLAGSLLTMWLGDQISQKGVGNGISMIIFAGIVSSLPRQIVNSFSLWVVGSAGTGNELTGVLEFIAYIVAFLVIIAFVTFIELSKRKIPVQHSGKGGQTQSMAKASYLPIKINSAGVIPVIFANSVMMIPSIITAFVSSEASTGYWLNIFDTSVMFRMNGVGDTYWYMPWGLIIYIVLIIAFAFFYANIQINPQQLAENFQKNGSYIPGVRPGNETERYVRKVLNRVTFIGAMALMLVAALPSILTLSGLFGENTSLVLGGTGVIIIVGVCLELSNQIDGLLAGKSYDEVVATGGR